MNAAANASKTKITELTTGTFCCRRKLSDSNQPQTAQEAKCIRDFLPFRPKCNRSPVSGSGSATLANFCSHYSLFSLRSYSPSTRHLRGVDFSNKPTYKVSTLPFKKIEIRVTTVFNTDNNKKCLLITKSA